MLAVGLILIVIATLTLLAALFGGSTQQIEFDLGPIGLDMTPTIVFLLGAATVLLFVMGLELVRSGARRARRRRRDSKELDRLSAKLEEREAAGDRAASGRDRGTDTSADTTERTLDDGAENQGGPATGPGTSQSGSGRP